MIDKKGFIEYLKVAKSTDSNSVLKVDTQKTYIACMDCFKIEGWFNSLYEFSEIDEELEDKIRKHPYFKIFNKATKSSCGSALKNYKEYLQDDMFVKSEVEDHLPQVKKIHQKVQYLDQYAIRMITQYMKSKGFVYSESQIFNFYLSLKTKPFVLLAGISGTGKTRLARLFAEAIGATQDGRYLQVAVKPDWSDSSDLFGYKNLKGVFEVGNITKFIAQAMTDLDNPYFLVLDEMNLARVEYYFSDFLSLLETRDLHDDGTIRSDAILKDEIQPWVSAECMDCELFKNGIYLPENLYVIGTVNMDESTFPFSKKVLDRAITIEFNDVDLKSNDVIFDNVYPLGGIYNSYFISAYRSMIDVEANDKSDEVALIIGDICKWNEILKGAHLNIGYRVRNDILFYTLYAHELDFQPQNFKPMDYCMMQKILPRIQGSSDAIKTVLEGLDDILAADEYPMSKEKIHYMLERLKFDGFTAFWL